MVTMIVGTEIDDNAIRQSSQDIQRRFDRLGQNLGGDFMTQFADGAASNAPKIQKAVDRAADATGNLRREQEKLDALIASGENDRVKMVAQSERVAKARRDEARAYKEATAAAQDFDQAGKQAGDSFLSGINGAISGAGVSGSDAAGEFVSGFAGSSMLTRLGAAGGPIGLALAGTVVLGAATGRLLAQGVADGMATVRLVDQFQGRMGLDESAIAQFGDAAGRAYANNFGLSLEDNLATSQSALRSGLIDSDATSAEVQNVIEQLQGVSSITDATTTELSRSMTTLMRTGLAGSMSDASDIITAGFQSGLDVSGDWLDTVNEYSTQFRKFGLDAGEVLTLMSQGLEGGARDTDKVADSLKEFSIRAVDGSKSTQEGFEALGFSAEDMGRRFAEGGDSAKVALDATFDAIKRIDDPMQQALIWQRLFGTQFEDMGDAINRFDLDPAANEFTDIEGIAQRSTKSATDNWASQWDTAMRAVEQRFTTFKTNLADWVTSIPGVDKLPGLIEALATPLPPPQDNTGLRVDSDVPRNPAPFSPDASDPTNLLIPGYTPAAPAPSAPSGGREPGPWGGPGAVTPGGSGNPLLDILGSGSGAPPPPAPDAPVAGAPKPILPDGADTGDSKPVIDPSRFSLDSIPIGAFEGLRADQLPGIGAPGAATPAQGGPVSWNPQEQAYGAHVIDQQKIFDAETSLMSQGQSVENARQRLLELQAEGNATAAELNSARTAVTLAERGYLSQQQKLAEAQQGTWQKMEDTAASFASGMDDVGAQLDNDFGLSDGIPGFFENLTKAIANVAAAPLLGPLSAIKAAHGDEGSGLIGIAASTGALGPKYVPGYGQPSASNLGPAALQQYPMAGVPSGGGQPYGLDNGSDSGGYGGDGVDFPDWVDQLAAQFGLKPSTYAGHQEDRGQGNQGIDWSGPVENMQRFAEYLASIRQTPGLEDVIWQNPNTGERIGVNQGRMVGTPGSADPGYFRDDFADHQNHVHTTQQRSLPLPGGFGAAGYTRSSGTVPVNVVNGESMLSGFNWDAVADKESGGRWDDQDTGRNGHYGGLQFSPDTWATYGGIDLTGQANPANATRGQQMAIADRTAFTGYNGTPPQGLQAWEAITNGSTAPAGITVDSRPPTIGGPGAAISPVLSSPFSAPSALGPAALQPPGALGPGPLPAGVGGAGGLFPGDGMPQAAPFAGGPGGPGAAPIGASVIPGQVPQGVPGAGAGMQGAIGGLPLAGIQAAASGLDILAPGAGAAANLGIQLANRTIGFAGQQVGNLWAGLFETFSLSGSGGATDPLKTLPGRLLAGIAGARAATPNTAGKSQSPQAGGQGMQNTQQMAEQGGARGALVNIENVHQAPGQEPDSVAASVASQFASREYSGGFVGR